MARIRLINVTVWAVGLALVCSLVLPGVSSAKTAQEIDASVDSALGRFQDQVKGAGIVLRDAKGVLVFPDVIQAGIGIGGQYGDGALRIGGRTVAYYSIASGSVGLQFGAQKKDIIIVFLQNEALDDFQAKTGWQVGVDGSVVIVNVGAEGNINSAMLNQPIVGFVVGQQGLMYNLTLEGTKISKVQR
jgi:lipid-binding SYLF domain-containing protein